MHFYTRGGSRAYEVPYADPTRGTRDATLADARKLGLVPGVTDVLRSMASPGLMRWKVREAIKATQRIDRSIYLIEDAWISAVEVESMKESKERAKMGSAIHKLIEHAIRDGGVITDPKDWPTLDVPAVIGSVIDVLGGLAGWIWRTEVTFAHKLDGIWYGGTADLVRGDILVDIKTKELMDAEPKLYDEHLAQAALYGQAMGTKRHFNLFVGYKGDVKLVEHTPAQMERGLAIGRAALALWYALNNLRRDDDECA